MVDRDYLARLINRLQADPGNVAPTIDPETIQFEAVRYKPGARVIISLSVPGPEGGRRRYSVQAFRQGESEAALGKLLDDGAPEGIVHHDPRKETVTVCFPWDHELPGLRRIVSGRPGASYVRRLIPGLVSLESRLRSRSFVPSLLRYKPERHAVYRLDFEIRDKPKGERRAEALIARVFPPREPPYMAPASLGGVTPRTLGYDGHRGVALEEHLEGQPLGDWLREGPSPVAREELLRRVGRAVAAFHLDRSIKGHGVAQVDPPHRASGTLGSAERLIRRVSASMADTFTAAAAPVVSALETTPALDPVRVHGDLHTDQILWNEHRIGLVDIEKSTLGEPEMDLGTLSHSILDAMVEGAGAPEGGELVTHLITGYVEAGGVDPELARVRAWSAWMALIRATAPLRNLHPEWRSMAAARVHQAERSVAGAYPVGGAHPTG